MKHCYRCKAEYPDTSRFCRICGGQIVDVGALSVSPASCPGCGTVSEIGWKFCKNCGRRADGSAGAPTSGEVRQAPGSVPVAGTGGPAPLDRLASSGVPLSHPSTPVAPVYGAGDAAARGVASGERRCPRCGFGLGAAAAFCKNCGAPAPTVVLPSGHLGPPAVQLRGPVGETSPGSPAPTPPSAEPETTCRLCGHRNHASLSHCESCAAPIGVFARRIRARKIFIAVTVVMVVVMFLAVGAVAAKFFLGTKVKILTDPGSATVLFDGRDLGQSAESGGYFEVRRVRRGNHSLTIRREGYDDWNQSLSIALLDFESTVNIKLNVTKYTLTVFSSPGGCDVLVDGSMAGMTNEEDGRLDVPLLTRGNHTLQVRRDGFRESTQSVQMDSHKTVRVDLTVMPVYDDSSASADREIRQILDGWARSIQDRDIDTHMSFYADTLDYYYNRTLVGSDRVRGDREKAFARFNHLSIDLSNINIVLDSTGQRATVLLDKAFDFRGDGGASYSGSVQNQLTVTKLGGAWLITGEKEPKVYYVNK